ncbi:MAG: YlmC/YmxH family sporulation protein [Firmicutes bacterium]|nr:YlmC/YmxH family sporulation protein [Bacillota bacterium]MDY5586432.1 YlmC/YmxH family sporulation protein [Eubacteriales bacterium]
MESSFLDLRCKEVINIVDGTRLGHIVDIVISLPTSQISGIVVPGNKSIFGFLKGGNDLFIPFSQICKIGEDAILVELYGVNTPTSRAYDFKAQNKS